MVFTVSYCIFGMTLLSMCMNLMQEQIVEKVENIVIIIVKQHHKTVIHHCEKVSWVAAELGMSGDGNDEEIVKLSIDGKVMIITTTMKMMMMAMAMTMTDNNDNANDHDGIQVQETPEGKDGNKTEFGFKKEKREKSAV